MKSNALVVQAGIGAIVLGLSLMAPLFDAMKRPLFHTFDLAHGSFFIACLSSALYFFDY